MKPIELLLLQGTKLPRIQLFGVYRGNGASGGRSIKAEFDGEAYVQNLTTKEKSYLTSGEEVEWDIPQHQATNFIIVGQIRSLELTLNTAGPSYNYIQEILFNNTKCEKFTYNAFTSYPSPTIPTITGNKYVKEMYLTIFGNGASTSSVYETGTFFQKLSKCNSSGKLRMEAGFINIDNINMAAVKSYTLGYL